MVSDHINSFHYYSSHEFFVYSGLVQNYGDLPEELDLNAFDAVVVHYSIFMAVDAYFSVQSQNKLKEYTGIKAAFIQDEYRFVDTTVERLQQMGFDLLFTCVPTGEIEKVYPEKKLPGLRKINTLTGFVPPALIHYPAVPLSKRRYDVSYRGRKYPAWHGRLGLEKWQLAKRFKRDARRSGLRVNIAWKESQRLYGPAWTGLIQSSRAVLGVESGASVFDFSGRISARVETVTALLGEKRLRYEDLSASYFKAQEDAIRLEQISPRIFEAIALRTLCVLYEGDYSGILEPDRHYLSLKKDHSNFSEVVDKLRNDVLVSRIIADAYAEIALNPSYSYPSFIARFDRELSRSKDLKGYSGLGSASVFPDRKTFYQAFPFKPIRNPYAVYISRKRKFIKLLISITPGWLKRYLKRILRVAVTQ